MTHPTLETEVPLLSREMLQTRWSCSKSTLHRMERAGTLTPLRIGKSLVRYRLEEIERIEAQAEGGGSGKSQ